MRPVITLALACAGFAAAQAALAQTLRCGFVLIQPGDDARYVLEKCGAPTGWTAITVPGNANNVYFNVYQTGVTRADRWLYHRSFGQFAAVLAIGDDGRVSDIQFERFRD
jgi:ABC-type sugar transport system substrate-binding protein